ncbi:unnamed protein product [Moneuplotes crassus]|uniref:Uncharacterized protein n=1 Tax=Euplotes crassus TaxID=5936 RepID=A0AAD1X3J2_EUPCR|nr:unnamed protein product [Moneuplotes crassus]
MHLQGVIQMMNDIQKALQGANLKFEIDLPRIAVVGAQSSGKSSVLESIVGEDFLPRGTGIVTRCPLILQLIYHEGDTVANFSHLPEKWISNFNEVRNEIEKRTNTLAGSDKKIVNLPIYLTIYSKNVPNLTLIDLPGFTKLDLDDQEAGISKDIEALVMEYIIKKNTIILAISPANNDIANSDGLLYAKKVDPNRDRTFGVMTKIDIMDKGTNALDFINGTKYKLKHGYIGVKCRSQDDNNKGKTIIDSLENEKNFFRTHPDYKDIAHTQGTSVLAQKLSSLLNDHILKNLPPIEAKVQVNLDDCGKSLESLGLEVELKTSQDIVSFINKIISQYCKELKRVMKSSQMVKVKGKIFFDGGARIYEIFQTFMKDKISTIDPLRDFSEVDILTEIRKINGIEPSLFVPNKVCKNLIKKTIDQFSVPSINCAMHVYNTIENSISKIDVVHLKSRKRLQDFLCNHAEVVLEQCKEKLISHIKDIILDEKSYINYDDPDFRAIHLHLFSTNQPDSDTLDNYKVLYGIDPKIFDTYSAKAAIQNAEIKAKNVRKSIQKRQGATVSSGNFGGVRNVISLLQSSSQDETETESKHSHQPKKDFEDWNIKKGVDLADGLSSDDISNIISVRKVVTAYIAIIKKQFKSRIPKCIVKCLIKDFNKQIRDFLLTEFIMYEDKQILAQEDPETLKKRKLLQKNMDTLKLVKRSLKRVKKSFDY